MAAFALEEYDPAQFFRGDGFQSSLARDLLGSEAGLDDRRLLFALFDAAVNKGMACFVVDYVVEVCLNEQLTSSDPNTAYLVDGRAVLDWCGHAQEAIERRVSQCLASYSFADQTSTIRREGNAARAVADVLCALQQSPVLSKATRDVIDSKMVQTQALITHLKVLQWLLPHTSGKASSCGRWQNMVEWHGNVVARRSAAKHSTTHGAAKHSALHTCFLDDLLLRLKTEFQCGSVTYPPDSAVTLAHDVFNRGRNDADARAAKLALLLYHRMDAFAADACSPPTVHEFRELLNIDATTAAQWQLYYWLDIALAARHDSTQQVATGSHSVRHSVGTMAVDGAARGQTQAAQAAVEKALALVSCCAAPTLPYKVIKALDAIGQPQEAAALLQSSGLQHSMKASASAHAVHDVRHAVDLLLRCGLLTHALQMVRRSCQGQQDACAVLISDIAAWCAAQHDMRPLLNMPLDSHEEAALCSWLTQQAKHGRAAGQLLPMLYLQRGRVPEYLLHANFLSERALRPEDNTTFVMNGRDRIMHAVAQQVPLPLQHAVLVTHQPSSAAAAARIEIQATPPGGGSALLPAGALQHDGDDSRHSAVVITTAATMDAPFLTMKTFKSACGGTADCDESSHDATDATARESAAHCAAQQASNDADMADTSSLHHVSFDESAAVSSSSAAAAGGSSGLNGDRAANTLFGRQHRASDIQARQQAATSMFDTEQPNTLFGRRSGSAAGNSGKRSRPW